MDCNQNFKIDLHIHSTASDGTLTPKEILALAQKLQLRAIAITDHDCIEGAKEALDLDLPPFLQFLTGVEISASSTRFQSISNSFHILGYGIRLQDRKFNAVLTTLQKSREQRNPKIIERLNSLGMDISLQDILSSLKGRLVGRPHIAKEMVKKGYVKTIDEAFNKFLGTGKSAYVEKARATISDAIEIIIAAGGIPVLAHPFLYDKRNGLSLEELLAALKEMGLVGLEVYYPNHSPQQMSHYASLAQKYGLLMTGGSDFHGSIKPDIQMGTGRGDLFIPYCLYEKIVNYSLAIKSDGRN